MLHINHTITGLKMRYNLHEVLDIGTYSVKDVPLIAREIESPCPTLVCHVPACSISRAISAKRYQFDLDMLYKDLKIFNHDPHVHYYLGITHQAYAEKVNY